MKYQCHMPECRARTDIKDGFCSACCTKWPIESANQHQELAKKHNKAADEIGGILAVVVPIWLGTMLILFMYDWVKGL